MKTFFTIIASAFLLAACSRPSPSAGADPDVTTRGAVEVTARLLEIPEGAIFQRGLYDYATILKYEVTTVHRGQVNIGDILFVGHYNPFKPRAQAADKKAPDIGGTLPSFIPGQTHRLALEVPIEDHYLGGIVDKYFGQHSSPTYWAVWTNAAE